MPRRTPGQMKTLHEWHKRHKWASVSTDFSTRSHFGSIAWRIHGLPLNYAMEEQTQMNPAKLETSHNTHNDRMTEWTSTASTSDSTHAYFFGAKLGRSKSCVARCASVRVQFSSATSRIRCSIFTHAHSFLLASFFLLTEIITKQVFTGKKSYCEKIVFYLQNIFISQRLFDNKRL